ncbi:MAG TPA: DUF885 domain-containing protein [Terriglobales bacterium]|nr:DUF885 domain-containing protein [Terriglobales bacterium]
MPMRLQILIAVGALLATTGLSQAAADSDEKLASDFWSWRARTAQYTGDDVTRMERPPGVKRDWSTAGVEKQLSELTTFEERWRQQDAPDARVTRQVDHWLIGSGLARVRWELEVLKRWQRDPNFYIEQTLTPVGEALTVPGPYDERHSREILARLNDIPAILQQAKANLSLPPAPFARMAIDSLSDIRPKLTGLVGKLAPETTIPATVLQASAERAAASLEQYRDWLEKKLSTLPVQSAIGREKYVWFLRNVALIPYHPEELVSQAQQEWRRAVAFEALEANRNRSVPPLVMAATTEEFIARHQKAELAVRDFLKRKEILTLTPGLQHFILRPVPSYLEPFADFVELDDFTSPSRLDQNGIRYVTPPSATGGYFWVADAKDPRIQIVHEGTVGHYGQLCASWKNPDPIRRHYYDSGANEGIGFYAEEMMLQSGIYDDSPHSREIVYNQMRLRALRVIADVNVALGTFSPAQAVDFMQRNVPMTAEDARTEVVEMGETPGQKISYQIGKLQIIRLMEQARLTQGEQFSVRKFHDSLWLNGNVPIALQRWEYLGMEDDVNKLRRLN